MCKYITQYIRQTYDPDCPEIRLTYCNIIFNEEIKIYIKVMIQTKFYIFQLIKITLSNIVPFPSRIATWNKF